MRGVAVTLVPRSPRAQSDAPTHVGRGVAVGGANSRRSAGLRVPGWFSGLGTRLCSAGQSAQVKAVDWQISFPAWAQFWSTPDL